MVAPQSKTRVVIDCDPGQDDAIALLLAFGATDALEIFGITTVGGNVGIDLTQRNARLVCDLAGRQDIPVYAGCSRPLVRDPIVADYYHGPTGMGGFPIAQPVTPLQDLHAVNFLAQKLMAEADNSVTLACLAPLTNVAMALVMEPRLRQKIKQIVFMGGAQREGGNTTPTASFNVFCDPHAAHVTLASGIPFVWVNLDVTHKLVMTRARLKDISSIGSAAAKVVHDMLTWDHARRLAKYGAGADGLPVSDLSVIAYLLRPDLFSGRDLNVVIDLQSTYAFGMTVVDVWGLSDRSANALWLQDVDDQGVFDLLVEALGRV
jgi:purine nucleosidase